MNPNDLLGTRYNPAGFEAVRTIARVAKAYHALQPYPMSSRMTRDWKTEERGPMPRCRPFVRNIVIRGARWLFGKPITFRVHDSVVGSKLINDAWTANDMTRRSFSMAVTGGQTGGMALKWSYDKDKGGAKIHVLDASEHTRFYWDPSDIGTLLMVRVQYPTWDALSGEWVWYREDWTDTTLRTYEPLKMSALTEGGFTDPYQMANKADGFDLWRVIGDERNPFGIIPLWLVRNHEIGREYGEGDLWSLFDIVDQINFNRDLEHKDNQKSIDPGTALIDLEAPTDDAPGNGQPGGERVLVTAENATSQGKVQLLETNAAVRPHLKTFCDDLMRELLEAAGSVQINPDEITNKGNLTSAVLAQIYAPLIEATEGKRVCYGEDGICVFFERMSRGLATFGRAAGWVPLKDIQIHWPDFWEKPEDEKMGLAQRQAFLYQQRFTTQKRAVQETATADGVIDVDDLLKEIESEPGPVGEETGEEKNGKDN